MAEPDNKFDEHAVMALDEKGRKLGYIPRHENAIIGALLKAGKSIYGIMPDEQPVRGAVAAFQKFAGRLPIVSHGIMEEVLPHHMETILPDGTVGAEKEPGVVDIDVSVSVNFNSERVMAALEGFA